VVSMAQLRDVKLQVWHGACDQLIDLRQRGLAVRRASTMARSGVGSPRGQVQREVRLGTVNDLESPDTADADPSGSA
jgi:hypothetical protein